ncbi:MAG: hypothetical protein ACYC8S_03375 [Minisyncoccota bacterium]
MLNQELITYIKQSSAQGVSEANIRSTLRSQGWQEEDINLAFQALSQDLKLPRKRKWKRWLLVPVLVIILPIFSIWLFPYVAPYFVKDIGPINDSDLRLEKVSIPDNENAYFDLIKISNVLYNPEDKKQIIADMADGKVWDEALAKDIIARNEEALKYFSDAANKPKFQDPIAADPTSLSFDSPMPALTPWLATGKISALKAEYLSKQGKSKEALAEALAPIEVGQKIQQSQGPLIEYLVGMGTENTGLKAMQLVVATSSLSGAELKTYTKNIEGLYDNKKGLTLALKAEYMMQIRALHSIIQGLAQGEQLPPTSETVKKMLENNLDKRAAYNSYYFQPNKTSLLLAETARGWISDIEKSCQGISINKEPNPTPLSLSEAYFKENAVGEILASIISASLGGVISKPCQENTLIATTRTIIGIKAFKNDTGSYPQTLEQLVPNYLPSVPIDPFDGKPLRYSPEKKIIYSVGKDGVDSGGSSGDDWKTMPDPTFPITF